MATPRLLDLTRSLRRAGRGATGVDRVERAYLDQFIADDVPAFGVMRTALGYVLLDHAGLIAFRDRLTGAKPWSDPDLLSRLPRGRSAVQAAAETDARKLASARALPSRLRRMMQRQFDSGFNYYNVGHSNLTERMLGAAKAAGGTIHALIHDVIPLEHPGFQRPGTVAPFEQKLRRVRRLADRVIYNSRDTRQRAEAILRDWGPVPQAIVAHLGTMTAQPDLSAVPAGILPAVPYFVVVGTIEPRKNHGFLLDLWEEMGPDAPPLLICGARGWNNKAVFDRLDRLPKDSPVREVQNLNDAALAAVVERSAGLLFPSLAEGFGLPPVEALTLKTRVLCNDLGVLREIIGDHAVFVTVSNRETWLNKINEWGKRPPDAGKGDAFVGPKWPDHFKTVLRLR